MLTDISDGGVRVVVESLDVPNEFTIILSDGRVRPCRLAWRIGYELGAEFLDKAANRPSCPLRH